jgi:thiamine-phosphate pyrophosphorylase
MSALLYYITDRTQFPGDESARRQLLLQKISEAVQAGVDYIQLREKDLSTRDLETLAREALTIVRGLRTENRELRTVLLLNSRTDVALAVEADGVHLRSNDIPPSAVRRICQRGAGAPARVTISISCHSPEQVHQAQIAGADIALFAPVFEKKDAPDTPPSGLESLRQACANDIPVLALGGVTLENATACLAAGAAGIAAIRLFQENSLAEVIRRLRSL